MGHSPTTFAPRAAAPIIGAFIEWFERDGRRALAERHEHTEECDPPRKDKEAAFTGRQCGMYSGAGILYTYAPPGLGARIDRIIALYFGIDQERLEAEKLEMLKALRGEP